MVMVVCLVAIAGLLIMMAVAIYYSHEQDKPMPLPELGYRDSDFVGDVEAYLRAQGY